MEIVNQDVEIINAKPDAIKLNGNIRSSVDTASDKELQENIKKVGLLNPLLVVRRPKEDGFTLVAGHRRFRAIKGLGWKTVPVRVVSATSEAALEMQIAENLQRQDLAPMDEARAFAALQKLHPTWPAKDIAARADKSVAYVTRALSLLTLSDKTIGLIEKGELAPEIGHQIARVEGKQREVIEKYATTPNPYSKELPGLIDVQQVIERSVERDLDKAVFPKDVEKYGGTDTPACVACPSNTGNQNVLFDGAEKGSCTNPTCYGKRTNAWYKEFQEKMSAKLAKLKFIGVVSSPGYMSQPRIKGYPVVDEKKFKAAMEKNPEKFGFAIVRPSKYDNKKKPEIMIVKLDKAAAPAQQPERDYKRDQAIGQAVKSALNMAAWKECRQLNPIEMQALFRDHANEDVVCTAMLFEGGKSVDEFIKELGQEEMLWLLFMSTIPQWETNAVNWDRFGINGKAIAAAAKKEAEAKYDAALKGKSK